MTTTTDTLDRPGSPVMEIRGLRVEYANPDGDALQAVDCVDLTLAAGQTLGLAGESGSGKSTLAVAATRLLRWPGRVVAGEVHFRCRDGNVVDLLRIDENQLQALRWEEIAVVLQSAMNALNPVRAIEFQLTDALEVHRPAMLARERSATAHDLMEAVGVPAHRLRSFPHELSGGMRQRVMIAMSIVLEPTVLVLDEPTTGLDVVVQRSILSRLAMLQERLGFAVLFITHDLSLLMELADTIAVMYAGRIVEVGASEQLYVEPLHPYTRGLLDSFPAVRGPRRQLAGIPGTPPDLRALPPGCAFAPRCPYTFEPCTAAAPSLEELGGARKRMVACHLTGSGGPSAGKAVASRAVIAPAEETAP